MQDKNLVTRQTAKYSLVNYLGAAIGVFSNLFIYPLDEAFLGVIRGVEAGAFLLAPLFVFGTSTALVNFFPRLKGMENGLSKFLSASLMWVLGNVLLVALVLWGLSTFFSAYFEKLPSFQYLWYSFAMAVFLAFVELFRKLATNYGRIAFPALLDRFLPKIFLPIIFLLLLFGYIGKPLGLGLFVLIYLLIAVVMVLYGFRLSKVKLTRSFGSLFADGFSKEVFQYSLFSFFATFGALLAFRIDTLMVLNLIGEAETGIYSIGAMLAGFVLLPAAGVFAIYSPKIAEMLAQGEYDLLKTKYRLTSKILLVIGGVLYCCVFLGIEHLFEMLPSADTLMLAVPVIIILGLNVVLDMTTSFNTQIIMYSKHYRFNLYTLAFLVVLNVVLNLLFINLLHLDFMGAAYATLISMVTYNLVKLVFIQRKFGMLPFESTHLKVVLVFLVSTLLIFWMPSTGSNLLDLVLKVTLSLIANLGIVVGLRWIPEINEVLRDRKFF